MFCFCRSESLSPPCEEEQSLTASVPSVFGARNSVSAEEENEEADSIGSMDPPSRSGSFSLPRTNSIGSKAKEALSRQSSNASGRFNGKFLM